MDKHLFAEETINDLLLAIMTGQREQVENYMRQLQKHHAEIKRMPDQELMPLLPLLSALQEASHSYFRQLLQITGSVRLMVLAVKNKYPVFEKLILLSYDESFVRFIYEELARMDEADAHLAHHPAQVFTFPAELAKSHHKEIALAAIYETAFFLDAPFLPTKSHPISFAARTNNYALAKAYIVAGRKNNMLNYDRPDGYSVLIDVLKDGDMELMRLCLENDANADIIFPTGESLLDAASSYGKDMKTLILSHGGPPARPDLRALHKAVNSLTPTVVNAEYLETLLENYRTYRHEYVNGFTLFSATHEVDIFLTAARQHNKAVLKLLLPYFKREANPMKIDGLIDAIFHTGNEFDVEVVPADIAIDLLRLVSENIVYDDPVPFGVLPSSDMDEEYTMRIMGNITWILHECHYDRHYNEEECKTVAMLLWVIGGGMHDLKHMKDLLAFAVSARNMSLIQFCLNSVNYSALDTVFTSAVWRVLTAHKNSSRNECEAALRFALSHGANINHRTFVQTSTLEAIAWKPYAVPEYAEELLRELGAT